MTIFAGNKKRTHQNEFSNIYAAQWLANNS